MHFFHYLANHASLINQIWLFTLISMVILYIACNLLPDKLVGNILPLHNVFRPETNVDLDFQSIGYALLHTNWLARITHYTIAFDAVLWFVIFQSWHWSIPFIALLAMLVQSILIGDKWFGLCFILIGMLVYAASAGFIHFAGMDNAALLSKVILMTSGLMRMIGHTVQLMPPLLLDNSDKFVKLSYKNINWKIPIVGFIGVIAEFGSGLPNRLLPVQVNFLYQTIFRVNPQTTLPWKEIEVSAKAVLIGGYSQLNTLHTYYNNVVKD